MHGDLVEPYGSAEVCKHPLHPSILCIGTCAVYTYRQILEDWYDFSRLVNSAYSGHLDY